MLIILIIHLEIFLTIINLFFLQRVENIPIGRRGIDVGITPPLVVSIDQPVQVCSDQLEIAPQIFVPYLKAGPSHQTFNETLSNVQDVVNPRSV